MGENNSEMGSLYKCSVCFMLIAPGTLYIGLCWHVLECSEICLVVCCVMISSLEVLKCFLVYFWLSDSRSLH